MGEPINDVYVTPTPKKGLGTLFLLSTIVTCLATGFGGGVYQSCNVTWPSKDDRAVCYYHAVTNDAMNDEEILPAVATPPTEAQMKAAKDEVKTK